MPTIATFKFSIIPSPPLSNPRLFPPTSPSIIRNSQSCPHLFFSISSSKKSTFHSKSSEEDAVVSEAEDEWLQKLPDKNKALYSHSLNCVEAWLKSLGFHQSRDDRAVWFIEKTDWHAQLSLDATDLYIRYLKSGPGDLEKDVERRFSYALSREDVENAILGGP
ncbi:hypothetical protein PHJA_000248900 [Phtheirospermum japonicum]|uniref:Uncharacterized protein n=1 Tax=Phtheirospermum japonicum TaxID=374723 RepID=A0A830BAL7_9LAMI|nr:hypothetical protein PHJA_000248900 [Phtheirospermum japonicum]